MYVLLSDKYAENVICIYLFITAGGTLVEVLARGPDALRAYKQSCAAGCVPLRRIRLFLVGPQGSGKSTLKKALLGEMESEDFKTQGQLGEQQKRVKKYNFKI